MDICLFTDFRFATSAAPTGVAKHMQFMAKGLSADPRFQVRALVPSDQIAKMGFLEYLPATRLPLTWKVSREIWTWCGVPNADRWVGNAEWVYSPKNDWIPVRKAKYAATIHGAHELDPAFASPPSGVVDRVKLQRTRMQYARISRHADVIFTVSEWLRQFVMERFHVGGDRVVVTGNGVDPVFYEAGKNPNVDEEHPFILCVGGFNHIDGGDRVLALAHVIRRSGKALRIKLAGSQHAPEMVSEAIQTGCIDLLGFVPHGELASLMAQAQALYFPTRYETFGMAAAEAMAAGCPVIASRCTAVPEIVGKCGLYVDTDRPEDALDALLALAEDEQARRNLVEAARARAIRFTWENSCQRLQDRLLQL